MFLISQIVVFGIGTYFRYSDKKVRRVIGIALQIISGLAIILPLVLHMVYHHHSHLS